MLPSMMRAVFLHGERGLSMKTIDVPTLEPDDVLVRVHCVGVCGTDLEIYRGTHKKTNYPIIPGHEWSGEIAKVGSAVVGYSVGDRVVGETTLSCGRCGTCKSGKYNLCPHRTENGIFGKHGAAAEFMAFPAHALHRFSSKLSFEEACLIEPASVAYRALETLTVTPKDNVAILGAGPIGLLSAVMAKARGSREIALFDVRENRLEMGHKLGADHVINLSITDGLTKALAITNGGLFSTVVEASGSTSALQNAFDFIAPGGRVCLLGSHTKRSEVDLSKIVGHNLEVYGSLSSPGVWDAVITLFEARKVNTEGIISHQLNLSEVQDAFKLMENKDPSIIKIILKP
jgi:L-iditol 2-dehydrogenase